MYQNILGRQMGNKGRIINMIGREQEEEPNHLNDSF